MKTCMALGCSNVALVGLSVCGDCGELYGDYCSDHTDLIMDTFPWRIINKRLLVAVTIEDLE